MSNLPVRWKYTKSVTYWWWAVVLQGHSAAIAAARAGCKDIVLMERYGYSGGDVTGGYVIMVPNLSWYDKQFVRGLQEEWFTRLEPIPQAVRGPKGNQLAAPTLC